MHFPLRTHSRAAAGGIGEPPQVPQLRCGEGHNIGSVTDIGRHRHRCLLHRSHLRDSASRRPPPAITPRTPRHTGKAERYDPIRSPETGHRPADSTSESPASRPHTPGSCSPVSVRSSAACITETGPADRVRAGRTAGGAQLGAVRRQTGEYRTTRSCPTLEPRAGNQARDCRRAPRDPARPHGSALPRPAASGRSRPCPR